MTSDQQVSLLGKVAAYTEILIKDPNSTIFVSLAEIYRKMGLFDDATQILSNGLEKHPDLAAAHVVLARILCQKGDYDQSCTSFEAALKNDPESLAALVGYARVKILLEHYDKAREVLLVARQLSPADPVINKLILSLPVPSSAPEEDDDEAVDTENVEIAPVPLISATIAELHLKQGMRDEALAMYRDLSEQDPDNLEIRRKIREIEKSFEGHDVESSETNKENDSLKEDCSEEYVEESNSGQSLDHSEDLASVTCNEKNEQFVLSELNRLLSNIVKRREHV